jgi:hypothetical protein
MDRATKFFIIAAVFGVPILSDFATAEKNQGLYWACTTVMVILLLLGGYFSAADKR